MEQVEFLLGEQRTIEYELVPVCEEDTVVISGAEYLLCRDGQEIERGPLLINGRNVSVTLCPKERGNYLFEVTVTVLPQVRKERLMIHVS